MYIIIIIGIIFRLKAIEYLGVRFTLYLQPQANLCTTGIYQFCRHPSYLGSLMIIGGISYYSSAIAVIVLAFWFFMARIKQEEYLMDSSEYRAYKYKVGMFFPRINHGKWWTANKRTNTSA